MWNTLLSIKYDDKQLILELKVEQLVTNLTPIEPSWSN